MITLSRNIFFFFLFSFYLACREDERKTVRTNPQSIEFRLLNQSVSDTIDHDNLIFYEWNAEVIINNKTNDTIWLYQYKKTSKNVLVCKFQNYLVYSDEIKRMNYYPDYPIAEFRPLPPQNSKIFIIALPLNENWSCPNKFYLSISPMVSSSLTPVIISERPSIPINLEKNTVYRPVFSYLIDQNCKKVTSIQENIDSLFINKK